VLLELLQQLAGYFLAALRQNLAGRPSTTSRLRNRPTTSSRETATCLIFRVWQRFSPFLLIRLPAWSTVSFHPQLLCSAVPRDPWRGELQQYVPL